LLSVLLGTANVRSRLADAAAAASCQQQLLLVLLECALLNPSPRLVEQVSVTLQCTLARFGEALWQLGPALLVSSDATERGVCVV
jgi:hypothetical protein